MRVLSIILAGGVGARFSRKSPKQFTRMRGKSILKHTVDAVLEHPVVEPGVIVVLAEYMEEVREKFPDWVVVAGGSTRQLSTLAGLRALPEHTTHVLIHDAVRPFVTTDIIERLIGKLTVGYKAVDCAVESADTIIKVKGEEIEDVPVRRFYKCGQTPQAFELESLLCAYKCFEEDSDKVFSDDIGVFFRYVKEPVSVVEGSFRNIKLTYSMDRYLAEEICSETVVSKRVPIIRKAAVVGGKGGIGSAIVEALGQNGVDTLSICRDDIDLRNVEEAVSYCMDLWNGVDLIVYAAGILDRDSSDNIQDLYRVNTVVPVALCSEVLSRGDVSGKSLLIIGSSAFREARKGMLHYGASKAALVAAVRVFRDASLTNTVNLLNPGRARTKMRERMFGEEPSGTLLEPDAVANKAVEICLSQVSGAIMDV